MDLYLMQHGQAVTAEENPERPLSREGVAQIQASATAMKRLGLGFDLIVCSPKKRSHQSAALVAEGVNYPYSDIVETEAVKPMTPAAETLAFLLNTAGSRSVLIAGHLPSLEEIASLLLGGSAPVRLRFDHGCLCRLAGTDLAPGAAELVFLLSGAQLAMLAKS